MIRPRLDSVDQMCVSPAVPLLHLTFILSKCLAKEEGGFWVSRGQDVCLIIVELEEIILMLKRDYHILPVRRV